jgi:transposase-like protein
MVETLTARAREMQRLIERWERSGLRAAEFARRRGLSPGTFSWWRHRLGSARRDPGGQRRRKTAAESEQQAVFTELVLDRSVPGTAGAAVAEIVLRSGRTLRVPALVDAAALRALVRVLEEPGC